MKIYIDLILLLNLFFDFTLLYGVNYLLKRRAKFYRLFLGSLIGALSIFTLFLPLNTFSLFILKLIISMLMILISFGEKIFFKTLGYFYILSIFLGGMMYILNLTFSYKHKGLIFFSNGLSINLIVMIVITPLIIYFYVKDKKNFDENRSNYYPVDIIIKKKKYSLIGYLDTGNNLKDPYQKRCIIITNEKEIKINIEDAVLVPFQTISSNGIIKCIKPDKVIVNNQEIKNCLIGKCEKEFNLNHSSCILPNKFKEML